MPGVESVTHNIYRWERGDNGLTDRYKLHYCRALGISPEEFGAGQAQHSVYQVSVSGAGALVKEIVGLLDDLRTIFREWRETLPADRADALAYEHPASAAVDTALAGPEPGTRSTKRGGVMQTTWT